MSTKSIDWLSEEIIVQHKMNVRLSLLKRSLAVRLSSLRNEWKIMPPRQWSSQNHELIAIFSIKSSSNGISFPCEKLVCQNFKADFRQIRRIQFTIRIRQFLFIGSIWLGFMDKRLELWLLNGKETFSVHFLWFWFWSNQMKILSFSK